MDLEDTQGSSQGNLETFNQGENIANNEEISHKLHLPPSDLESKEIELSKVEKKPDIEENFKQEETLTKEQEIKVQEIQESDIDKNLYEEVLEKLDIKPKKEVQDIQEKSIQGKLSQTETQIEKAISQDFLKIQALIKAGLINSAQGQNLKKEVLKKAFDKLVQTEKIKRALSPELKQNLQASPFVNKEKIFEEFSKSNPDFFTSDGRKEVLNYLKSDGVIVGKEELNKISEIVRLVEKAAIDRYLKKAAHEKTLRDLNETAKQRLTANAQKSGLSGNLSKTFTREQIGKMTSAEFTKYESMIMEQLKKGLIR